MIRRVLGHSDGSVTAIYNRYGYVKEMRAVPERWRGADRNGPPTRLLDLASCTVKIAGVTSHPREEWMMQMARNLTDSDEPFLRRVGFLIMDRDTKYSETFRAALTRERIEPIRLPSRSPDLNAFAERFVRPVKEERVGRMLFFGRSSLDRAPTEYTAHCHRERNHQGLRNRLARGSAAVVNYPGGRVKPQRLGGMLNFYHRGAA